MILNNLIRIKSNEISHYRYHNFHFNIRVKGNNFSLQMRMLLLCLTRNGSRFSYFSCNGCMEIWYAHSWIVTHFTSENTTLCVFQFTIFIHTIRPTFLCELKSVVFVWFFDNFKIHVKRNQKYLMHIYIYILSVRKIFGEDGELMSLILPGIINRSRSVCHLHPIQGLVVIYMPSYFFTTMVFLNVKRA